MRSSAVSSAAYSADLGSPWPHTQVRDMNDLVLGYGLGVREEALQVALDNSLIGLLRRKCNHDTPGRSACWGPLGVAYRGGFNRWCPEEGAGKVLVVGRRLRRRTTGGIRLLRARTC